MCIALALLSSGQIGLLDRPFVTINGSLKRLDRIIFFFFQRNQDGFTERTSPLSHRLVLAIVIRDRLEMDLQVEELIGNLLPTSESGMS